MSIPVLWLCSWYPNREDAFTGDFVERHARAVSGYRPLSIWHVRFSTQANAIGVENLQDGAMEVAIRYLPSGNILMRYWKWFWIHKTLWDEYISKYGLPPLVHVHIPFPSGLFALYLKLRYKIPYVVTEHYGIYNNEVDDRFKRRNIGFRWISKAVFAYATKILPVSDRLGRDIQHDVGIGRYTPVPNVVNTNLYYYDAKDKAEGFRLVHVSDGSSNKQVEKIIVNFMKLLQQYPTLSLHIVGISDSEWKRYSVHEGLFNSSIFFYGIIPYHEVSDIVRKSHVGILYSRYETQSCVLLEYLCAGLPVIAPDTGGVTELINSRNGILVNPYDDATLWYAMCSLYEQYDSYDKVKISAEAHARYSYAAVGRQLCDIYDTMSKPE